MTHEEPEAEDPHKHHTKENFKIARIISLSIIVGSVIVAAGFFVSLRLAVKQLGSAAISQNGGTAPSAPAAAGVQPAAPGACQHHAFRVPVHHVLWSLVLPGAQAL